MRRNTAAFAVLAVLLLAGLSAASAQDLVDEELLQGLDEEPAVEAVTSEADAAPGTNAANDLDQLLLQEAVASAGAEGCATAQHGVFGAPMAAGLAAAGGYGAAAKAGSYGGYGGYGMAAAGGYGSLSAAAAFLASKGCAPLAAHGKLMGVGPMAGCKGTFVPLAPELSVLSADVETDAEGSYTLAAATLGTHSWKADKACVDAATKLPLGYNWALPLQLQTAAAVAVTDLALLTAPASEGLAPAAKATPAVFDKVYKAFGIDGDALQIDVMTYGGVKSESPAAAALAGTNAQLSFLAHATAETMLALMKGPAAMRARAAVAGADLAELTAADVAGIQQAIWNVLREEAGGNGKKLLTSPELIAQVLAEAAKLNDVPQWSTFNLAKQKELFRTVAKAVGTSNKEMLKPLVDVSLSCAAAAAASSGAAALPAECASGSNTLRSAVASVSQMQKTKLAADVTAAAEAYVNTGDAANTPDTPAGKAAADEAAEILAGAAKAVEESQAALDDAKKAADYSERILVIHEQEQEALHHHRDGPAGADDGHAKHGHHGATGGHGHGKHGRHHGSPTGGHGRHGGHHKNKDTDALAKDGADAEVIDKSNSNDISREPEEAEDMAADEEQDATKGDLPGARLMAWLNKMKERQQRAVANAEKQAQAILKRVQEVPARLFSTRNAPRRSSRAAPGRRSSSSSGRRATGGDAADSGSDAQGGAEADVSVKAARPARGGTRASTKAVADGGSSSTGKVRAKVQDFVDNTDKLWPGEPDPLSFQITTKVKEPKHKRHARKHRHVPSAYYGTEDKWMAPVGPYGGSHTDEGYYEYEGDRRH